MPTQQPSALRYITGDHPAVLTTARARIEQRRKEAIEHLAGGLAGSFEDYRERAGHIHGLNDALALIDEVEGELIQGKR